MKFKYNIFQFSIWLLLCLLITLLFNNITQAQVIVISEYSIQNRELGLEQNLAKNLIKEANDWLTKDDPNVQTLRVEDNVRAIVEIVLTKNNNSIVRKLKQLVINTTVLDSGFVYVLNNQTLDSVVNKKCFWLNEKNNILNPSITPDYISPIKFHEIIKPNRIYENNYSIIKITDPALLGKIRLALKYYINISNNNLDLFLQTSTQNYAIVKCGFVSSDLCKNFKWFQVDGFKFMNASDIRIVFGDNLLHEILEYQSMTKINSTNFSELNYSKDNDIYKYFLKLFNFKYRFNQAYTAFIGTNTFASYNIDYSDANINLGFESEKYAIGLLLPFLGGNSEFGIYKKRILTPTLGLNGKLKIDISDINLDLQAKYTPLNFMKDTLGVSNLLSVTLGSFVMQTSDYSLSFGVGYNIYNLINKTPNNEQITNLEKILYPIIDFKYSLGFNSLFFINTAKYSFDAGFKTWLTENFGVEFNFELNNLLKKQPIYEHKYLIFFTPLFRF